VGLSGPVVCGPRGLILGDINYQVHNQACQELADSLLQRRDPIDWLDWLPLLQNAVTAPPSWIAAFRALSLEQQFELAERLRLPAAGPLADALLVILARYADEIEDDQVRLYILEDAEAVHQRRTQQLQSLQHQMTPLAEQVTGTQQRLAKGFEIAQEITRLEQALAEMRIKESEQDERFTRVHALERELLHLETRKRFLSYYNEAERQHDLQALHTEVTTQQDRKAELERRIAEAVSERDAARRTADKLAEELRTAQDEMASDRTKVASATEEQAALAAELEQRRAEEAQLRTECAQLTQAIAQQQQHLQERREALVQERDRLDELQSASERAGLTELENKVREVYALLPEDLADQAFS
jgi:chromosome segregation ATPase